MEKNGTNNKLKTSTKYFTCLISFTLFRNKEFTKLFVRKQCEYVCHTKQSATVTNHI